MKTLPDRIRIEYRLRIETETAGLNAQEAAVLTRKLEDEKEMHLNDTAGYVGLLQSSSLLLRMHQQLQLSKEQLPLQQNIIPRTQH